MKTDRLLLRKFVKSDWKDLYAYLSCPQVVQYEPYEVYSEQECIEEAEWRAKDSEHYFWAVCLQENQQMIGHIYFAQVEPKKFATWEIGYVFNPQYYGRGYATEACKRMLKYGFIECKAHRIVAGVNVENKPSWRLLERLSMRREAFLKQNVFFALDANQNPIWHDSYRYALLAEEFHKDCLMNERKDENEITD